MCINSDTREREREKCVLPNSRDKYDEIREMYHTDTRKRKQIERREEIKRREEISE